MCSNKGSGGGGGSRGSNINHPDRVKALNLLEGHRGVAAFDSEGKAIGVSNKTEKNGALKLTDGRLLTADSLMFTTGNRDAKNTVIPSQKYAELFANSKAQKMEVIGNDITYTITKTSSFDREAFKKNTILAHQKAQKSLKYKADIIDKAYKEGKINREEAIKQKKKANKAYSDDLNSFYKSKNNQRRYGFTVTHN